ncbi:MAG: tripartite tricarboxylate transporter substrate binding protein [Betaproteobacteria bacterium]|nr:tripartite tricarboxylate transporter substrate binding protein [Betaproteobacteria bacterium]
MRTFTLANLAVAASIAAVSSAATVAHAQSYPVKPIRIVVAYPPGGPNDLSARTVGQKLSEALGQPVIVENRAGAAGNIGSQYVAASAPDGYTLLNGASALTIAPALTKNLNYDVVKDFAPISLTTVSSFVLAAHPSVPVNSIKELIALAKSRPGQLNYASSGVGAPPHLAGELLKNMAKIDILHVPYKGVGQSITDLVGGQVDMMFTSPPNAIPHVKSGRLKALAVSTARRSPLLPDVPTIAESGLKGFEIGTWFGLLAPAGASADIVNRLNGAIVKIVNTADFRERLSSQGMDAMSSTPAEFSAHIKAELAKFSRLVQAARIRAE